MDADYGGYSDVEVADEYVQEIIQHPLHPNSEIDDFLAKLELSKPSNSEFDNFRQQLPAFSKRQEIIDVIRNHQVVVISGDTGCGKTTQVPQYILEDHLVRKEGSRCKIVVTQPRRISAIGVATRVAEERGEKLENAKKDSKVRNDCFKEMYSSQ
jgi:ATP-dependent RNA helicase DHX57